MHFEILDDKRIKLLEELSSLTFIDSFTLGGGTALSLQLGLRYSYDFDFFSCEEFSVSKIISELEDVFGTRLEIRNVSEKHPTVDVFIDGVQVSFLKYRHKEIDSPILVPKYSGIKLFSIKDIACMKSIAINQRGGKKDFFDLFFILKDEFIKKNLHKLIYKKYKEKYLLTNLCQSMVYFEDAKEDVLPKSFVTYSWPEIESFFIKYSKEFLGLIEGYSFE